MTVATRKNRADLDITDANIKGTKASSKTPAAIVKILYGIGVNPVAYEGAVFDGRYVYFVPSGTYQQFTAISHSEVLRYDTTSNFESAESWSTFDAGANGVGNDPVGYAGGIFDGRYIYFVPFKDSNGQYHGEVLRYDTTFQE